MQETLISDMNYQMWGLIHQLRHAIYQIVKKELKSFGLSPAKTTTLFVIKYSDEQLSPGEIAKLQLRSHNSVSVMIDGLAKDGLVKKTQDPNRKNVVRVALTEKGEQACNLAMKSETIPRIFSCLTKEESKQLISSLEKVLDKVHEELGREERRLPFA
jgi:MarR family transcriptional regulator, organic hydroperoxide resistance regulator